jgi:hypothetical protein
VILDEIASRPSLPRHLDTQIFGYLDELEKFRSTTARPSASECDESQ